MPVRLATLLAALVLALTLPTAALGQGAGDDQYTDPFGSGQNDEPAQEPDTPTSSDDTPSESPAPAPTAAPAAPAQESAGGQEQLPYTGSDAGLLALGGALLLGAGVALRVRVR